MIWTWDPSAGAVVYILAVALVWTDYDAPPDDVGGYPTAHGAFTDDAQTADVTVDDGLQNPPIGMAWLIDVDAVDEAGNRSPPGGE